MTLNASRTFEFTIDRLLYNAYRKALLIPAGAELTTVQRTEGTDALEFVTSEMITSGVPLRLKRYDYLTLTADSEWVNLGADVWDVSPLAMYIPASEANPQQSSSEVPVERDYGDTFQRRGGKAATGQPSRLRLDKEQSPFRLELWPIPTEAGKLRVESFILGADNDDPNATPDTERHWAKALLFGVAAHLAESGAAEMQVVNRLEARYEKLKQAAMTQSMDVAPQRFVFSWRY